VDGDNPCTVTIPASLKVGLGNYESAEAFVSVANIPAGASDAQIQQHVEEAMGAAGIAWKILRKYDRFTPQFSMIKP